MRMWGQHLKMGNEKHDLKTLKDIEGMKLKKRSFQERAHYVIGEYLKGSITLLNLSIQLNTIVAEEQQHYPPTSTS